MTSTKRYSDAELEEFRVLIQTKLDTAKQQLEQLQSQIFEITENSDDEYGSDWMDDSSINNEIEILNDMAIRQRKYIQDLENAMVRIKNKTYGICVVSGELIDKKRLLAVPTTTKSIAAKNAEQGATPQPSKPTYDHSDVAEDSDDSDTPPPPKKSRPTTPIIIDKVIRKTPTGSAPKKPAPPIKDEEDEDFDVYKELDFDDEDESYNDPMIDPDTLSDDSEEDF